VRSPNASCDVRSGRTDREVTLWGLNREMATTLALIFLTASTGSLTAAQREVVRQVDQRLLAPCCYSQAVGEHMSSEAAQMRQEIEEMAASGESEATIITHYKAQYGERILVVPDGGTGRVLFILPPAALLLLATVLILVLRRMVRAGARRSARADQEELERLRKEFCEAIDRELRDMA